MEGVSGSTANEALVQQATVQQQQPPAPAPAPQPATEHAQAASPSPEGNKGTYVNTYA